jgi:hypothetical protein
VRVNEVVASQASSAGHCVDVLVAVNDNGDESGRSRWPACREQRAGVGGGHAVQDEAKNGKPSARQS